MRTLVFGSTGYIGRHITRHLLDAGYTVTAAVRKSSDHSELGKWGADVLVADLNDLAQLASFGHDYDAIIWAAQLMLEDERKVVETLLDSLAGTGKTFVFTSGTSLLSQRTDGDWSENTYAEDDPFPPRRQIAPRLEVENIVRQGALRNVRTVCVRPPLVWGNGGSKVIADLYHSAHRTGSVCYVGRGLNVYSNVHVEDLAELYRLVLEKGVAGALYHAVAGELCFRTIAECIAGHLNLSARSITVTQSAEIWDRFMGPIVFSACSRTRSPRARMELGWLPNADRQDILEDCAHPDYRRCMDERAPPAWVRVPTP